MKLGLPFKKRGTKTLAVCDIGSGSIAVAIVEASIINSESSARILVSERRTIPVEMKTAPTIDQLKTLTQETATAVLDQHAKKGGSPPEEVVAIVHAPWVRSETLSASQALGKQEVVSAKMITAIAQQATQGQSTLDAANMFERSVTRVALNGYPTAQPEGKTAARIDISVLQSEINPEFKQAISTALGSAFVGRTITFHSAFFALTVVIRSCMPDITHYTLIDVTSIATSAVVIRRNAVLEHADAPLGWRTVTAELATITGTTPAEALSRVRIATEETCTDALCQSVIGSLAKIEPTFVDAYGKMFNELAKAKRIPAMLILVAPPDVGPWFANIFSKIDFAQFAISEQPFSVHQLFGHNLADHINAQTGIQEDAGIWAAAGFVHIRMRDNA
ncbi:MAG: hypothetical protein HYT30_00695 [Parcubacteria group bacterium]|nr:hypothetical protein [Parcubacteria group bacterium]